MQALCWHAPACLPFTAIGVAARPHLRTVLGCDGHSPGATSHHWCQRGQLDEQNAQ